MYSHDGYTKIKGIVFIEFIGGEMDKGLTRLANDLKKFIVDNKFNVIFTFILGFTTFGIRITYLNYGMDTLNYMYDNNEYLNHWIKIGRPGMYFFKKLFGPYMNIWLANVYCKIEVHNYAT